MYKSKQIQKRYLWEQFQKIPKTKLHEFAGPITTSEKDRSILETWTAHFESVKVPYIVIKRVYDRHDGRRNMAKFMVAERVA